MYRCVLLPKKRTLAPRRSISPSPPTFSRSDDLFLNLHIKKWIMKRLPPFFWDHVKIEVKMRKWPMKLKLKNTPPPGLGLVIFYFSRCFGWVCPLLSKMMLNICVPGACKWKSFVSFKDTAVWVLANAAFMVLVLAWSEMFCTKNVARTNYMHAFRIVEF